MCHDQTIPKAVSPCIAATAMVVEALLRRPRMKAEIIKLDNVTWFGHCVITIATALRELPGPAKHQLIADLQRYLHRQASELRRRSA